MPGKRPSPDSISIDFPTKPAYLSGRRSGSRPLAESEILECHRAAYRHPTETNERR